AMGEVASAMAHELNQPLTAVMNYVQASRRLLDANTETAKGKALGYMDKAIVQAGRAGDIIRGLRKFVEKEDTERTFEDINEIINEAIALVLPGGRSSTMKLTTKLSPNLSEILVHKVRLQQVVVNLVRNALEALEGREAPHIEVSTRLYRDSTIEVCICDNGPGLPDEVSQKLFQSFVTTKQNGMGVGLSICKTIVEEHGGEINAIKNEQGGVTFCFTLPTTTPTHMESGNV
ncbi:GHKL domain-containing protein, partial [bacterium AH-315-J23]|nr:GHKL domain-containing protein [bacterium AH-315-J23]